jgi:hypothetical protein
VALGRAPRTREPRYLIRRDHPGWEDEGDAHRTAALATSVGTLTTLDPNEGFPDALQQVVDAAKLLFQADGAGLMLVGKDELLTWASASDAHAERAEAVQAELGAGDCMVAWRERSRRRCGMWRPSRAGPKSPRRWWRPSCGRP